jgi:hypothetical protein
LDSAPKIKFEFPSAADFVYLAVALFSSGEELSLASRLLLIAISINSAPLIGFAQYGAIS